MHRVVRVLTSMAPRDVLVEAAASYRTERSILIDVQSAGGVDVARRVEADEVIDIVVLASDAIDKLIAAEKLLALGRADLMKSEIAIGVPAGTMNADVVDEPALRRLVLEAKSISYSTGPSGKYLETLFERWGIHDELRDRIVIPLPGVPVAQLLATGQVAVGFQQLSELINVPGVDVAGLLPSAVQLVTTFSAGISRGCDEVDQARQFVRFAASGALDLIITRHGMSPVG